MNHLVLASAFDKSILKKPFQDDTRSVINGGTVGLVLPGGLGKSTPPSTGNWMRTNTERAASLGATEVIGIDTRKDIGRKILDSIDCFYIGGDNPFVVAHELAALGIEMRRRGAEEQLRVVAERAGAIALGPTVSHLFEVDNERALRHYRELVALTSSGQGKQGAAARDGLGVTELNVLPHVSKALPNHLRFKPGIQPLRDGEHLLVEGDDVMLREAA